ncbi:MAG TPA: TIGR04149 family rSAM-modified RiPP [Thermoanaerobaculia bacterium]|nr:TIGR04149 family rSAM-modified RiPP [Thermoanaerobaculia bacterium]
MKKIAKTLNLNRETLRSLDSRQLDPLAGGTPIPQTSVCSVTCPIYCFIKG